jgi:hypothetical protein
MWPFAHEQFVVPNDPKLRTMNLRSDGGEPFVMTSSEPPSYPQAYVLLRHLRLLNNQPPEPKYSEPRYVQGTQRHIQCPTSLR